MTLADYLDLASLSNFFAAMKMNARRTYTISCRKCGKLFVNKLGPNRRLRCRMLKENNYVCPRCVKQSIDELEVRVMTLCYGLTIEEMSFSRGLNRND